MDDAFERTTRELVLATLQVNLEEDEELEQETREWIAKSPGSEDIPALVEWSASAVVGPYFEAIQEFVRERSWAPARRFLEMYGSEQLYAEIVVSLLRWMRELPSHQELLAEPPMKNETANTVGSVRISQVRFNERVLNHPDYIWFWKSYLDALVQAETDLTELPFAEGLKLVVWRSGEISELGYALGRLEGRLEERERMSVLSPGQATVLAELKAGFEAVERRDRTAFALQLAQAEQLARLSEQWKSLESLVLDAAAQLEDAAGSTSADSYLAGAAVLNFAVDRLARDWERTHSERERSETERQAIELVGAAAWERLQPRSRRELTLRVSIDEAYFETGTLIALLALERELGSALQREGLAVSELGHTYERKLEQASRLADDRVAKIAAEMKLAGLHRIRNTLAHGRGASVAECRGVASVLFSDRGQKGFIGRLALIGSDSEL